MTTFTVTRTNGVVKVFRDDECLFDDSSTAPEKPKDLCIQVTIETTPPDQRKHNRQRKR